MAAAPPSHRRSASRRTAGHWVSRVPRSTGVTSPLPGASSPSPSVRGSAETPPFLARGLSGIASALDYSSGSLSGPAAPRNGWVAAVERRC